jgi:acetylornithine deacetylase/succinyl-diaminopimelate desuccinylase-like protein
MVAAMSLPPLTADAEEMCAHLLRIDTTNPPGNERPAVDYLAGKLREVGYDVTILESAPGRANLVTRYRGTAPPRRCSWPRTSMWSRPTRPSGATRRSRARSPRAACGVAARST